MYAKGSKTIIFMNLLLNIITLVNPLTAAGVLYCFRKSDPLHRAATSKITPMTLECNKMTLAVFAKDLPISYNL